MLAAIKHGLGNLVNFRGRDSRQAFWYYVLFVYIITIVITMFVMIPPMIEGMVAGVRQGIAAGQSNDPAAAQAASQAMMAHVMASTMSTTLWLSMVIGVLMLALLAAAFVRRVHDSDMSGWWALIPGAVQVANLFLAPATMHRMMDAMSRLQPGDPTAGYRAMQGSAGASSLLGWAAILVVIVLGIRKSTPGPNRFGEAPFVA